MLTSTLHHYKKWECRL